MYIDLKIRERSLYDWVIHKNDEIQLKECTYHELKYSSPEMENSSNCDDDVLLHLPRDKN
jgi:hypothetical protein